LQPTGTAGRFTASGSTGFDSATLEIGANHQARLSLDATAIDLSRAARGTHMVTVSVEFGTYTSSHTRLWTFADGQLTGSG
jgi:hypothetical protein